MPNIISPAIRHLVKNKLTLTLNLVSLILGFLVCSAIMLNAWQQFRTDHFIVSSDRIFRLNCGGYGVTPSCFKDLIGSRIPEIEESSRLSANDLEIIINNDLTKINKVFYTDSNSLRLFEIKLIYGSAVTALKDPFSIVVTESLAYKIFGNTSVIGKTITHNKKFIFTVTGVMKDLPENSHLKINALASIQSLPAVTLNDEKLDDCGSWNKLTYLRLKNANQRSDCEKKINKLLEDHKMGTRDGKIPLRLEPFRSIYFNGEGNKFDGSAHGNLLILLAFITLGILTLIIAWINCINFSISQSEQRIKELNMLRIFGATKGQIGVKLIIEMLLLFLLAGIISSVLLELSLKYFSNQIGFELGFPANRTGFYILCLILSTILGIITGLITAFQHYAKSVFLNSKIISPISRSSRKGILFILFQYLLAAVFMAASIIVISQIDHMLKKDRGFRPLNVLQIELDNQLAKESDYLKRKVMQESGVEKLAFSDSWIGEGFGKKPVGEKGKEIICNFFSADPDYIDVMGITVLTGRNYSWLNSTDSLTSIIMNETAARSFELKSVEGQTFQNRILVGIVKDFNFFSFKNEVEPFMVQRLKGKPRIMSLRLSAEHQKESREKILNICKEISPDFHNRVSLVSESLQNLYGTEVKLSNGIALYAIIAFVLSILGITGVCVIRLQKRQKEMAIRRIQGASIMKINKLVLWDFVPLVLLANIISVPITIYMARQWLQSYAYHASISPIIFIGTTLLTLVLTSIVIILITTISSRTNPAEVLREE